MDNREISTRVLSEVAKMDYKQLSVLLGISKPAAFKKIKNKAFTLKDADIILSKYRIMYLDKK